MSEHIIFVGNPGSGKSTLLNSLTGELMFKSGVSLGSGMTQYVQFYTHENVVYGDTPGLSDVEIRKQAAQEICKALRQNGNYKLVFVCTQESGRVKPEDITTMKLVLEAIDDPQFPFGIVVNKVSKRIRSLIATNSETAKNFLSRSDTNPDVFLRFYASLNSYREATSIFIYPEDERLKDEDNVIVEPNPAFVQFLKDLTSKVIREEQVKEIKEENFEESKNELETKITQLERIIEELTEQKDHSFGGWLKDVSNKLGKFIKKI